MLVVFVATAAVVPVLISPSRSGGGADRAAATSPATSGPQLASAPTASPTPTVTPTPTPSPKRTVSPFLVRPAVKPRPVGNPPNRLFREFMSVCAPTRQSSKPPLPGLAAPGKAVRYQFAGSTSTKPALPGKVPTSGTSCVTAGDSSTYWTPVLRQGSKVLRPDAFEIYYKAGVRDYTTVQPFPVGLRMLAGGPEGAASSPERARVTWACSDYGSPSLPKAGTCKPGDRLILQVAGPSCWDGRHLDVAGHRSHLTWPVADRCPGGHPIPVPELLMWIAYPFDVGAAVRSDAGPGEEFGYGFVAGWQKAAQLKLIKACIHTGQQCDVSGKPR